MAAKLKSGLIVGTGCAERNCVVSLFDLGNPPKAQDLREKSDKYWANKRYNMVELGLKRFLEKNS